MNIQDIKELMQKMAETGLTQVEFENNGSKLRLERTQSLLVHPGTAGSEYTYAAPPAGSYAYPHPGFAAANPAAAPSVENASAEPEELPGQLVNSPVVGVFYASPSPDSDPFVTVGSKVEAGSPLCIIEAMKLMNEVTSQWEGVILEILVENGQRVEFGQPLFRIGGV